MASMWIEVDTDEPDEAPLSHEQSSETTSVGSSIYRGVIENGRRYQTIRQDDYWGPSDEQQYESQEIGHLLCQLLDSDTGNTLFHAPVEEPKHILDIGTGKGTWAVDVADRYPDATVRGVDLFPPPTEWVPPNCHIEVDDLLLNWTWREPFDLIHLRFMIASWTPEEWEKIYTQCYDHLTPGGWIEQLEVHPSIECVDNSLPPDASIRQLVSATTEASKNWNRRLDTASTMRNSIEKAGFIDIHEKTYRWPIGPWAKNQHLKEAGRLHYYQWLAGMEGWVLKFLTNWARPEKWTEQEVQLMLSKVRDDLNNTEYYMYQTVRRIWARKPTDDESDLQETEIITPEEADGHTPSSRYWWWS